MLKDHSKFPAQPLHIAIIMDGNGRWAKAHGLPRADGHRRGTIAAHEAVKGAIECGVSYLTLFGFSSENWKRPHDEVNNLMELLRSYLLNEVSELHDHNIRLCVIGERLGFDPDITRLIEDAEQKTLLNTKLTLIVAINYSGRQELVRAAKRFTDDVISGNCDITSINEQIFASNLFTAEIPDPDLLIRTSGEKRISNFLLWQLAYAEMIFLDILWPDFSKNDLNLAICEYQRRSRRYGDVV
ncbi:MAG: di-trans,poly-cis-decaprenylcistransferase [Rhodospirillaceae bacterium]|nr:di-trans,poly-cis-decaprenylcistransferase [Rhodospirillaceae bacterium]